MKDFPSDREVNVMRIIGSDSMYGLEIVKQSAGGLARNSIYVYLRRLLRKGFIKATKDLDPVHHGMPRPRYSLTPRGKRLTEFANSMERS